MRILQVSAELFPLLKTGGLADVAGALPLALMAAGQDARVLLPGFPAILAGVRELAPVAEFTAPWGPERFSLRAGRIAIDGAATPITAYVIDAPALYDRPGNPYEDATRQPYGDNHRRFALLGWA
ncbi:MAG: glycogen/starch synthase, partial [Variovorax paradoxus]